MLVGSMVHNQLGNNFQATAVGFIKKRFKIFQSTVVWVNCHIVSYIVAVITQR